MLRNIINTMSALMLDGDRDDAHYKNKVTSNPIVDIPSSSLSTSRDSLDIKTTENEELTLKIVENEAEKEEITSPKPQPTAFTIDFGGGVDKQKLDILAKKSQARHQRVQSMSAGPQRTPLTVPNTKPPLSGKLSRKTHGYNSEGYFSSDQEDSVLSGSRNKHSPNVSEKKKLGNINNLFDDPLSKYKSSKHEMSNRNKTKSPIIDKITDSFHSFNKSRSSKSSIVDNIMSRSDIIPSRNCLNLPLSSSYDRDTTHKSPSYGNLSSSYNDRMTPMNILIDNSPEVLMLSDISSPELDAITPDNALYSPVRSITKNMAKFPRCVASEPMEAFVITSNSRNKTDDDYDDDDRHSNNSSTGTYTIEGDNYTEEQKSRMSIDRNLGAGAMRRSASKDKDPELVIEDTIYVETSTNKVIMKQGHPRNLDFSNSMPSPVKKGVPKEKNVLEITCCYESPTESNDLASATSKQIKSTRNYLEKIKNRVKTISEKTFQKPPVNTEPTDMGSFTSVTTSGVLSSANPLKIIETPYEFKRKNSLTKSQIDSSEYIHRLTRETSVPVCLPSENRIDILENARFESGPMKAIQNRNDRMSSSMTNAEQAIVNRLSHLSLNRCKGDKQWIQEWAESVKKYNTETLGKKDSDASDRASVVSDLGSSRPPASPRHAAPIKATGVHSPTRGNYSASGTPTKIPSPLGYTNSRQAAQDFVQGGAETESYLMNTQNAITNLQAKLKGNRNDLLTTSVTSATGDRASVSKLPVSQLSRSNSLNYRLRSRDPNSSPLRNPGNYVITGSAHNAERAKVTMKTAGASRSLDTDQKKALYDSNMNSPTSDRGLKSTSSEDKTLSNVHLPWRTHSRHKSFEGGDSKRYFGVTDRLNMNSPNGVSLKAVLKSNAEAINIDQTRGCHGDGNQRMNRQRAPYEIGSPGKRSAALSPLYSPNKTFPSNSIRRSSSFSTVNRGNAFENAVHQRFDPILRRSSGQSERTSKNNVDYLTDESENDFSDSEKKDFEKEESPSSYGRTFGLRKARIDSPDVKSRAPSNSPKCPNTPEMPRKFGPGLVRNAMRATVCGKDRVTLNGRLSDPVKTGSNRDKTPSRTQNTGKKISDSTRQEIVNRLTKSRSTSRDFQPKVQDKGPKKPNQHRSSQSLASKEAELSNWKRRSTYDPRKAAQEGKKKVQERQIASKGRLQGECMKDDLSSPSHSSPVHRSQSFHCSTVLNQHSQPDYSSEDTDLEMEDQLIASLPPDHPMITSTHSDILEMRPKFGLGGRERRQNGNFGQNSQRNDVVLARDYVTQFQVNQPQEKTRLTRRENALEKRRTFIMDDHETPPGDSRNYLDGNQLGGNKHSGNQTGGNLSNVDKRKTYVLDSDTNSTTNGSSPRNSSIFSDDRLMKDVLSDCEDASSEGPESAPVVMRQHSAGRRTTPTQIAKRHSGDYSLSSSTTSASNREFPAGRGGRGARGDVQPRYLDISKYKAGEDKDNRRNFLRKDASKTYVGVLPEKKQEFSKGSAQQYEMAQRKQEMEKWKRRALYDPRKAAAQDKAKTPPKSSGSVLRSQSFHGPVTQSLNLRYLPTQTSATLDHYDGSSDNDF